jgi:hypothetical protein
MVTAYILLPELGKLCAAFAAQVSHTPACGLLWCTVVCNMACVYRLCNDGHVQQAVEGRLMLVHAVTCMSSGPATWHQRCLIITCAATALDNIHKHHLRYAHNNYRHQTKP